MPTVNLLSRHWLIIVFVLVALLQPWQTTIPQAAAQSNSLPPRCPGPTCVWLPLVGKAGPVTFRQAPVMEISRDRSFAISGDLITTTDAPVYLVRYDALLFDGADKLVQTVPITPMLAITEPGRTNPVSVSAPVCCDVKRIELRLASWQMSTDPPLVSLPVETLRWTLGSGFAVAIRNNRDVPVRDVFVLVRHTTGTYTTRIPLIAPGEVVVYDNPEGDDFWGFFFHSWAQGYLTP